MGLIFILLCKINVEVNDGSSNDMENHPLTQIRTRSDDISSKLSRSRRPDSINAGYAIRELASSSEFI
jgi:hypothetical protein